VPMPVLRVIAEGQTSAGQHWYLRAGGTVRDYYTLLETVHPGGRRDEGGMGGPLLFPGRLLNSYSGRVGDGPLRVIVRADRRVRRLVLRSGSLRCDLRAALDDPDLGATFYAILLPWPAVDAIQLLDADGRELTP